MSALMFQMASSMMNVISSKPLMDNDSGYQNQDKLPDLYGDQWGWVGGIIDAINTLLYPILALVGTAGVIYAIYLGVNLARAESADKQQEAKKRLINAIIGLACIVALVLLMKLLLTYLPQWIPELSVGKKS